MTDLADLIPTILEKTREKKLIWSELSSGSFVARLGESSFSVGHTRGETWLSLLDDNGRALETVSYNELQPPIDRHLEDLYEMARRQALRVDEALSYVKEQLARL